MLLVLAGPVLAVSPEVWEFNSESDFTKCERESTVVNSHGDVTLARKIEILLSSADAPAVVAAVVIDGERVYAASGTDGWVYKITPATENKTDDKDVKYVFKKFAKLPSAMVTCMVKKGETILAGGGGTDAGIYAIAPDGKIKKVFAEDVVKYVWAIVAGPKGELYAATGPEGIVYSIDESGKGEVLYHIDKKLAKNILCLALREDGKLLAGTDQSGLVIEINPATKIGRVVFDAAEKEISSIVIDNDGGLFAATSDAAKAGATSQPTDSKNGKAESQPATKPAEKPAEKPEDKKDAKKKTPTTQPVIEKKKTSSAEPAETEKPGKFRLIGLPTDQAVKPAQPSAATPRKMATKAELIALLKSGAIKKSNNSLKTAAPKPAAINVSEAAKAALAAALKSKSATTIQPNGKGNAVYSIDSQGMVRTIFRKPVTILAMIAQDDRLILATGQEGQIYYVTKDGTLSGELIDTDAKQVTAVIETPHGDLIFATSNKGSVGLIGSSFATSGTLTSKPSDAKQIAQWGTIKLRGVMPDDTKITVATRSGNLEEASDSTWSSWSKEMPLEADYLPIGSPAGRFLQYRVTFSSDGKVTPSLGKVEIIYQVGNLAPAVLGVAVQASNQGLKPTDKALTKTYRLVAIQAFDPNKDTLVYTVDYRLIGTDAWVEMTDSLKTPKYVWDTRTAADGLYELRITASDEPSNIQTAAREASRVSEPVTVDNTPPALQKLVAMVNSDQAIVTGQAIDAISRIVSMQYSVDSVDEWKTILPTDGICDSTTEAFRFETDQLKPGPHRISIRATDVYENTGYAGVNIVIEK